MTNNLLPMLPYSQNSKIFGPQYQKPQTCNDAVFLVIQDELERMLGAPVNPEQWVETKTQVAETGELGPKGTMGKEINRLYGAKLSALDGLLSSPPPSPPKALLKLPGWTFYPFVGKPHAVPHPKESVFFFDVETYVKGGGHPVIGVALSSAGWYLWLHPQLCHGWADRFKPELIPLGPGRVVVAHNALFDLSKTKEAYNLSNRERPMGLCTMAMHGTISAMGGEQVTRAFRSMPNNAPMAWLKRVCGDSLKDCLKFHVGLEMDKEARDLFVKGSLPEILNNLDNLLDYAFKDVEALAWLGLALFPKYRLQCPSDITLVGMLELSRSLLVVEDRYDQRVQVNDMKLEMIQENLIKEVRELVEGLVDGFLKNPDFDTSDPWLSQLDWTPARSGKMKGYPKWYREITAKKTGLTLGSRVVPLVTRMTWKGQPLSYHKVKKWGWVNPLTQDWERLPHPDGEGKNVGSPLSKHFAKFVDSGTMGSESDSNLSREISNLSYWVSFQSRFREEYKMPVEAPNRLGIVPTTKIIGTLTGRQVHRLWLTAAQCKPNKLGTDMFHVIQPPEGWSMVLWDEDTEEVRIAAIWGDFQRGLGLGATALSQIAFLGEKRDTLANSTDAHSVTAKLASITRDEAKVANFRDIFGGGRKTQSDAIQTSHPDWTAAQIDAVVSKILDAKRGQKVHGKYEGGTDSFYHNQAAQIAETPNFRLPATGRMLPDVINTLYDVKGQFYTSRYNFPVQGTGVDILHATAVAVPILCNQRGIPDDAWGYVMARHDEIGYNVKDEYADQFAEIANAAHCWAWSIFLESLGFNWMPSPLARLSAINIDKVYRKEVKNQTDAGYGVGWNFPDGRTVK